MTAYRRAHQPGGCWFFTVVTEGRRPLLIDHVDHLRRAFRIGLQRRPATIDAIVVLPDHLHTLWRLPEGDSDYSIRWMTIKRLFSAALPAGYVPASNRHRREKAIWQRRFWEHLIRDETDWRRHMDYIHYNPVKHGYCGSPVEWPYGSFRRCVRQGLYPADWGRALPEGLERLDLE
jgi:putative transposase